MTVDARICLHGSEFAEIAGAANTLNERQKDTM